MYKRNGSSVYIPPSYRGNALYFEALGREEKTCEEEGGEQMQAQSSKKEPERRADTLLGRLGGLFGSDSAVVIAVVLFLLFSKKDGCDERGEDLLTLFLIALVLL